MVASPFQNPPSRRSITLLSHRVHRKNPVSAGLRLLTNPTDSTLQGEDGQKSKASTPGIMKWTLQLLRHQSA
ncbi:hypothetical protein YEY1_18985 [Yersinia enterocolitica subsp. palearctica]|nr:hypothetical protein YEY1_18985 [Yersinia enterocolitica subsp. palearctica]